MRSRYQIRSFSSFWRDQESWSPLVGFENIRSDFVRRGCRVVGGGLFVRVGVLGVVGGSVLCFFVWAPTNDHLYLLY